jgi:peptide/nickel transport system substrate-binding protein
LGLAPLAYDSLVNLQPDGTFVSGVAEKWTTDAGTATFTLRSDVTCSDGSPLTAGQTADALNFVSDPKNKSRLYGVITPTVPVTATGDDATRTVKVVAKKPFGFLLNTIGTIPIICAKGLANPKALDTGSDGTGPYVLTNVVRGQTYTFTRRKDYRWGPGGATTKAPGTPAKVVLRVMANTSTVTNLLLSGTLNFAQITGDDQQRVDAQGLTRVNRTSGVALFLNQLRGRPAKDKRMRQAIVQALDLGQLLKVSTGGINSPATGLRALDPKVCTGDTVAGTLPGRNVSAAGALLDQLGYAKGPDGIRRLGGKPLTLDLHYATSFSPLDKPTTELLGQQLNAVGIQTRLTADSTPAFTKAFYETGNWDLYLSGYGFYLPSQWIPYASGTVPPDGVNISGIDNKDYSALAAKAVAMTPPQACTYWNRAEQSLFRDVDVVPISFRPAYFYLKNAEAKIAGFYLPIPTSMRVLK